MRDYEFYYTQDGSVGLYSYSDNDVYHSKYGALTEAWEKFIIPSNIDKLLQNNKELKVLDVCYGIGYNTKSLMSYIINSNKNLIKNKNIFFIIKNFFNSKKNKVKNDDTGNIETICDDNIKQNNQEILSTDSESIYTNKCVEDTFKESKIKIDCLEVNEELVKLSPLLKTIVIPQDFFSKMIMSFLNRLGSYKKIKRFLAFFSNGFLPQNRHEIEELLDIKFKNDYNRPDNKFYIHEFVNYIMINTLIEKNYKGRYISKVLKKTLRDKKFKRFVDKSLVKYAIRKQKNGYDFIHKLVSLTFLHNIYYKYISKRYKELDFNYAEQLFDLNFYVDDARASVKKLSGLYDLIFFDAFTFSKAPELWSVEFIAELYNKISPNGLLLTYSNSALIRNTLLQNHFYVGKIIDSKTGKSIGTVASKEKSMIEIPLTNYEMGLCSTRAGIPYHDPTLKRTKEQILKQREFDFKNSDLMTSSQYMKIYDRQQNMEDTDIEI